MLCQATALHVAAASGKAEAAVFLLENGAEIAKADGSGFTPLHYAQILKKQDTFKALKSRLLKYNAFTDKQVSLLSLWLGGHLISSSTSRIAQPRHHVCYLDSLGEEATTTFLR